MKTYENDYVPVTFARDEYGVWNVCIRRLQDKRLFWVDIWVDEEYNDVSGDWNQYIFITTDPEDMERQRVQNNCYEFDNAIGVAIEFLENNNEIIHNSTGWFIGATPENWNK